MRARCEWAMRPQVTNSLCTDSLLVHKLSESQINLTTEEVKNNGGNILFSPPLVISNSTCGQH